MAAKEVIFGDSARRRLASGVDIVANAVRLTLGPKGRDVALERGHASPVLTKDGVTVAREIDLEDPLQNIGAQLIRKWRPAPATMPATAPPPLRYWHSPSCAKVSSMSALASARLS